MALIDTATACATCGRPTLIVHEAGECSLCFHGWM